MRATGLDAVELTGTCRRVVTGIVLLYLLLEAEHEYRQCLEHPSPPPPGMPEQPRSCEDNSHVYGSILVIFVVISLPEVVLNWLGYVWGRGLLRAMGPAPEENGATRRAPPSPQSLTSRALSGADHDDSNPARTAARHRPCRATLTTVDAAPPAAPAYAWVSVAARRWERAYL